MSAADRMQIVKRSGRIECLHWAWARCVPEGAVVTNHDLLLHWVKHVVSPATGNVDALRWVLSKTMYSFPNWVKLVASTVGTMLCSENETLREMAFAVAINEGGGWWHVARYQRDFCTADAMQSLGICFMRYQRWDLVQRLLDRSECWPMTLTPVSRYTMSIIMAVRSEDMAVFVGWWGSAVCKAMLPADAPPANRILARIIMAMVQHANPAVARSAHIMGNHLMSYMADPQ